MTDPPLSHVPMPLSGWGRYPVEDGYVIRPESMSTVKAVVQERQSAHILARGKGRSYGDASFAAGADHLLTERMNRMLAFDQDSGLLVCEAGLTLEEILETFVPRGWFPPVTPGTKFVTVGGAFACDVHGKNHHKDGSFSNFVNWVKLLTANGEVVIASRSENESLFHATAGGMGLTGIILELGLRLTAIQTSFVGVKKIKTRSLEDTFEQMEALDKNHQYSVSWLDCLVTGKSMGRSILMLGDHAALDDLSAAQKPERLALAGSRTVTAPGVMPDWLLNRLTMKSFNALYYWLNSADQDTRLMTYDSFFYPLDCIAGWNKLYGRRGFTQYQFVLPLESSREGIRKILSFSSGAGMGSFLTVLKRLGAQEGPLAFPLSGYTLTLDLPVRPGLADFIAMLDRIVIEHGGRVYLAKDAFLTAESFRAMYRRFPEWLSVKRRVDPQNLFTSRLSQRLKMNED